MNAMNEMPAPLNFTDAAAEKVRSLIEEEGNPDLKLRVFVTGGGCSGFQYGFTFDEIVEELRISKSSASNALKMLEIRDIIEIIKEFTFRIDKFSRRNPLRLHMF